MPGTGSANRSVRPSGKSTERKQPHLRVTPSGGALPRKSSNENFAPLKSTRFSHSPDSDLICIEPWPGEVSLTIHFSPGFKPPTAVTSTGVPLFCQTLKKREKASSDEQFIHPLIQTFGRETAEFLAARFGYSLQPPLPESPSKTNERGKNYSARSAKRKPLSGSSASSRKRS